ncbi:MAG: prephenate dehydrogenase/arogenate dehydrogenase family protein, partial [Paludibacteraceae bacterium]
MKILIIGAGKMGTFLTDVLCLQHEVALYDTDPKKLRFVFNTLRLTQLEEIEAFEPELLINCVTLKYTISAFEKVLPYIPKNCIISDIASVKTGLRDFYQQCGLRFVSSHPMFGPTFATLDNLSTQSAIVISESDHMGKAFFKDLYQSLRLMIFEYTFDEHDETIAYSLSIPFASTLVFASVMKHQEAPGT